MCAKKLGQRHPETPLGMEDLSIADLALIWKCMGRCEDALRLLATCLDLRQQALGVGHPHTASTLSTPKAWREENEQLLVE
jgi:hypothetical protein